MPFMFVPWLPATVSQSFSPGVHKARPDQADKVARRSHRSPRARRVSNNGGSQVAEAVAGGATGVVLTAGAGGDGDLYDAACKLKVPCCLQPAQGRSPARQAR